jgi:hypothetical protein
VLRILFVCLFGALCGRYERERETDRETETEKYVLYVTLGAEYEIRSSVSYEISL